MLQIRTGAGATGNIQRRSVPDDVKRRPLHRFMQRSRKSQRAV